MATHVRVLGDGPPVLLLHGLGGVGFSWRCTWEGLAPDFTVLAPDLPGHGQSTAPPWDYSLKDGARWVTELLGALGIRRASLVGNSLGGLIAGATAIQAPGRVEKLVLVAAAGLGRDVNSMLKLLSVPVLGELVARPSRRSFDGLVRGLVHDPSVVPPDIIDALWRERIRDGQYRTVLRVLRAGVGPLGIKRSVMLLQHLPALTAPVLVVWGEQDRVFPVQQARRAADLAPRAVLRTFAGCGHWPHLEHAPDFNRLASSFLKRLV